MKRDQRLIRLSQEHHKALVLCLRIEREVPEGLDDELSALFEDVVAFWRAALLGHFRAENECLVTRLIRYVPLEDELVARVCRDHVQLDGLVVRMLDDPATTVLRERLQKFGALLREHIHWEEDVLFERTQQVLQSSEMDALSADLASILPESLDFPMERLYPKSRPKSNHQP